MGWTRPGRGWEEALTVDRDLLHPAPTAPPWAKKAFRTIGMSQVTEFLLYPPPPNHRRHPQTMWVCLQSEGDIPFLV